MNSTTTSAEVFSYCLSYDELVATWIEVNERFGHILVIYEPKKHMEYLESIRLPYAEGDMYLAELLIIEFNSIDEAKMILGFIKHSNGPFVQLWSMNKLITDNIEFNPTNEKT